MRAAGVALRSLASTDDGLGQRENASEVRDTSRTGTCWGCNSSFSKRRSSTSKLATQLRILVALVTFLLTCS